MSAAKNATENDRPHTGTSTSRTQVERASDRELIISRVFRAPPHLVFDAMTKPELLRRWWAPRSLGVSLIECEADVRVGGRYRYVFGRPGEPAMAFSGAYREVVAGARVVYTQVFEPTPEAGEGLITAEFQPHPDGTQFFSRERYPSKDVLDNVLATGMERGMRESMEQLEELVRSMA
jgi:uncharacterized protein YndB with AHSA1/START domain